MAGERFALDNSAIAQGRANGSRFSQRYNITYFNLTCVPLGVLVLAIISMVDKRSRGNHQSEGIANGHMYRETPRQPHSPELRTHCDSP